MHSLHVGAHTLTPCCAPTVVLVVLQARTAMRSKFETESQQEEQLPGHAAGAWKWALRKQIWDFMEANDIARSATLLGGMDPG